MDDRWPLIVLGAFAPIGLWLAIRRVPVAPVPRREASSRGLAAVATLAAAVPATFVYLLSQRAFFGDDPVMQVVWSRVWIVASAVLIIWLTLRVTGTSLKQAWHPRRETVTGLVRLVAPSVVIIYAPSIFAVGVVVAVAGEPSAVTVPQMPLGVAVVVAVVAGVFEEGLAVACTVLIARRFGGSLPIAALLVTGLFLWGHGYQGVMMWSVLLWVPLHLWLYARTRSLLVLVLGHVILDSISLSMHAASDGSVAGSVVTLVLFLFVGVSVIVYLCGPSPSPSARGRRDHVAESG